MAMARARKNRQKRREEQQTQGTTDHDSTMDFDQEDDDDRRRNTSSEDEGDEGDYDDNQGQLATTRPPINAHVASLVDHASQMMGRPGADGTAMALAAANAPTAAEALNLLAASSAVANMGVERAGSNAARAMAESGLATEGLRNSDSTYEKRFKRYDEELQSLKDREIELQKLQIRVTFLEGLLGRVLSMMQNGDIDAAQIADMLRNLGI